MKKLRGACGHCLVAHSRVLVHKTMIGCAPSVVPRYWVRFKKMFEYAPHTYCRYCGTPQDQAYNYNGPACHRWFDYGSRELCEWNDLPYITVWSIWHLPRIRERMCSRFSLAPGITFEDFNEWIVIIDSDAGEFTKLLEVFLWFCEEYESSIEWAA